MMLHVTLKRSKELCSRLLTLKYFHFNTKSLDQYYKTTKNKTPACSRNSLVIQCNTLDKVKGRIVVFEHSTESPFLPIISGRTPIFEHVHYMHMFVSVYMSNIIFKSVTHTHTYTYRHTRTCTHTNVHSLA